MLLHLLCLPHPTQVCIFAYGQTGSGKTFTMLGRQDQPGMIPRAMRQVRHLGPQLLLDIQ